MQCTGGSRQAIVLLINISCIYSAKIRSQDGRTFGQLASSLAYRFFAPLKRPESGPDAASEGKVPAVDYKEFNTVLTWSRLRDPEERKIIARGFVDNIVEYACAALNARCNFTLYFGVDNRGRVTGIEVESYDLVSNLT